MKKIIPLIAVMILLIVACIFLFTQNQNLKNEIGILNNKIADLEKQKSTNITPTPTAEKPPQGWKEYADNEYKFRLWYPKEFSYKGIIDQTKIQKLKYKEENLIDFYVNVLSDAPLRLLYIYIYNNDLDIKKYVVNDAEEIIKNFPALQNKNPEYYITVSKSNGLDLYKFEIPSEYIVRYYLKKDNNIFMLRPENVFFDLYPGLKLIVDHMINSFNFIE